MKELNEEEIIKFENALLENDEYKAEFEEIKSFFNLMTAVKPAEADESELVDARYSLMRKIRSGEEKLPVHFSIRSLIDGFFLRNYKFVFSAVFTVVVCVFIGKMIFTEKPAQPSFTASQEYNAPQNFNSNQSNEIFPAQTKEKEEEDNRFDAVKPVERKDKTIAPVTGRILAASLLSEANPGLKLQTLNKIAGQEYKKGKQENNKLKEALIATLKNDSNPAVRKEAFMVLSKFPYDEKIQDAFLYTLTNDKNSGLRVLVIKTLSEMTFKGERLDQKTKTVLSKKAETDNNGYVRIHAASMIKEVE